MFGKRRTRAPSVRGGVLRAAVLAALIAGVLLALPAGANAAPPANDNLASATSIGSLPFSDSVDVTEATFELGQEGACMGPTDERSVWYSYTPPNDEVLRVNASNGGWSPLVSLYRSTGTGYAGLTGVATCSWGGIPSVAVSGGSTYYLRVARHPFSSEPTLSLTAEAVPPPPNDAFGDATPVAGLPYSDSVDAIAASREPGEPSSACGYWGLTGTIWYAFTPTTSDSYTVSNLQFGPSARVAVYTGDSVGSLTQIGCQAFGNPLTFHGAAGTTYHLQVGALFDQRGTLGVSVRETPDPVAGLWLNPFDPSIFDTVQFFDQSYDPGGAGIATRAWSFGDGSTSELQSPTHRYAADGDYEVTLTVTTPDGRTGTASRIVQVRTHDVAIARFAVPQSAVAGQTRTITVGVSNTRRPETLVVNLRKRTQNGSEFVGQLRQLVAVRTGGRTTEFKFTYTFTAADAAIGKVTFEADAWIEGARDAIPGDNYAIALPTKVTR